MSWLVAHIVALLLAYAALGFSLLSSVLYLVQERRIKAKLRPGHRLLVAALTGCPRSTPWSAWPTPRWNSVFPA